MSERKPAVVFGKRLGTLLYITEGSKKEFLLALLMGLSLNAFIAVVSPLALKYLFDEGIIRRNFRFFVILSICFVFTFTVWRAGQYFCRLYIQRLRISVTKRLCLRMVSKYYELPYDEIIKKQPGYFVARIYDEVTGSAAPLLDCALSFFNSLITLIIASITASFISWRAAVTIVISVPLVYAASNRYAKKVKQLVKIEKEEEAKLRGILGRAVGAYKIVRIFDLKNKVIASVTDSFHQFADAFMFRFRTGAKYEVLSGTLMSYVETTATIGAGYQMLLGRLSFGGFMGFMNAFWLVIGSVKSMFDLVPEMSRINGLVERLREFEDREIKRPNITLSDALKLEDVNFSYNGKSVLQNYRLDLRQDERVLIIGPNGSGKSTLAHVITGLLHPATGVTTTFPLSRISAVIYPHDFIPGTVTDNVSFAMSESEIVKRERLLTDFGLGDHLGQDTSQLSAGQRKKLELIMSLVKEADVYVIDEPLAGIDVKSKQKVMDEIFTCTRNKILIAIMHGDQQFHGWFDRIIDLASDQETI
jgi:ABC-type multidrug transport system fused ATPase/permease subunit